MSSEKAAVVGEGIDFASAKNFWQSRAARAQSIDNDSAPNAPPPARVTARAPTAAVTATATPVKPTPARATDKASAPTATPAATPAPPRKPAQASAPTPAPAPATNKAAAPTVTATATATPAPAPAPKPAPASAPTPTPAAAPAAVPEPEPVPAPLPRPSTPEEKYPEELEEEVEPKLPPPSPVAPAPTLARATTGPAASTLTRMASFRPKFFTGNSGSELKENDASPSASTASTTASQTPEGSSWKMKMTRPLAPKMSFSFRDLSTQLKTSITTATAVVGPDPEKVALARNNIHRPTPQNARRKSGATPPTQPTAFGELVVAEVLAAKDLTAAGFQGESDSYIIVRFKQWERRTTIVKGTTSPVFNERFVFWVPSPSAEDANEPDLVSIVVMNKNLVMSDMHLGEVHISMDIPVNDAFDEWYPLVKENGEKQGEVRIGVRRMLLTSSQLQLAARTMATNERSLNDEDLATYGSVIPDLWYGFAEAAEPLELKASQTEVLTTKLNDLSRRFIGIEIKSTEVTADGQRRDVF